MSELVTKSVAQEQQEQEIETQFLAGSAFSLTPTGEQFCDLIGRSRTQDHPPRAGAATVAKKLTRFPTKVKILPPRQLKQEGRFSLAKKTLHA